MVEVYNNAVRLLEIKRRYRALSNTTSLFKWQTYTLCGRIEMCRRNCCFRDVFQIDSIQTAVPYALKIDRQRFLYLKITKCNRFEYFIIELELRKTLFTLRNMSFFYFCFFFPTLHHYRLRSCCSVKRKHRILFLNPSFV